MSTKTKLVIGGVLLVLVLGVLFAWPKFFNKNEDDIDQISEEEAATEKRISDAGLECLDGHTSLVSHIHPELEIYIDGKKQAIPSDIGITFNCMAEIHTHDEAGVIHVEAIKPGKKFALKTFFDVWGEQLEKDGYRVRMTVNGKLNEELGNLILKDKDKIIIRYSSESEE